MWLPFVLATPWIGVLAFLLLVARKPRELPPSHGEGAPRPLVSVIVPARNESINIEACVRSLVASRYPAFEVIVVDDGSTDGTADLVRAIERGNARSLRLVDGAELPAGWLGKPWACSQGAGVAEGDLLLFTDADTRHAPDLLARAVEGLRQDDADLLTVVGRQLMETFWERLVQPQIFMLMFFRFPRLEDAARNGRWRDAIANGQYMLFRRAAYERIGGHASVRDEVVEDLALAQRVKREGLALRIRAAESDLSTRMYRSLSQLVEGWSKNIVLGGLQSLPRWLRPIMAPISLAVGVGLWIAPPAALAAASLGVGGGGMMAWASVACAASVVVWAHFTRQMGGPAAHGLLYPLGAAVGTYIFLRSWSRGGRVEWKGRRYDVASPADRV